MKFQFSTRRPKSLNYWTKWKMKLWREIQKQCETETELITLCPRRLFSHEQRDSTELSTCSTFSCILSLYRYRCVIYTLHSHWRTCIYQHTHERAHWFLMSANTLQFSLSVSHSFVFIQRTICRTVHRRTKPHKYTLSPEAKCTTTKRGRERATDSHRRYITSHFTQFSLLLNEVAISSCVRCAPNTAALHLIYIECVSLLNSVCAVLACERLLVCFFSSSFFTQSKSNFVDSSDWFFEYFFFHQTRKR